MKPAYLTPEALQNFISSALSEDIGPGDFSSLASIPENKQGKAKLIIKDAGILAGVELAGMIFTAVDPGLQVEFLKKNNNQALKQLEDLSVISSSQAESIKKSLMHQEQKSIS